jgi:transglutaminase-like putative cysteine protease
MKGRGVDATLAAMATLVAAWPISTLLTEPTWLGGTLLLLAVIALSGVGARSLSLRGWQVLVVQVACAVLAAGGIYGRGHLWHGLPTFDTLRFAGRLAREAFESVHKYAAPAPTTPGLIFVTGCALGLIAVAVDYLAITRHSPSLAGLPLLGAFLAAAANSGSSLPVIFFLAAAAMWLILVARQGTAFLRRWATTVAVASTPVPEGREAQSVYGYASIARALGVAALVTAAVTPAVLPHLHPTFLAAGLGRSPVATGNVSGGVGFSLSINLAEDLNDRGTAPVVQYKTTDTSPPPLRVAVSDFYRSAPGVWLPWGAPVPPLFTNPEIPEPVGLLPNVPKTRFTATFVHNLLNEPNIAVPYPMVSAQLGGIAWGGDTQTQNVRVAQRPDSYTVSYWRLEPPTTMLESTSSLSNRDRVPFGVDLKLDGPSAGSVTDLEARLTTGKTSDYDKAMAIQQYLRATGGFTYSLTLAPPARDRSGRDAGFDPLTNFLVTKRGYCVQFATAMVMMARAAGIPAHMAIGFLPGTRAKGGVWTVTAADAHAWPELYLDGIGWTRFEPTPSRAAPPVYAIPKADAGTPAGSSPTDKATAAPRSVIGKDLSGLQTDNGVSKGVGTSLTSGLRWLTHGWGLVLLAYLLGLLGSLVVPTAASWRRRRHLIAAQTSAQQVEVRWAQLTSSLSDLGIARAPSRTPRQLRAYYDRAASLEGAASEALGRVTQTLEISRYAAPGPVSDGLVRDARDVLRAAAAARRRRDRVRAAFLPSEGFAQLRAASANIAWRASAPWRGVNDHVERWFSRRR